jgi:hypothetical protein
VLLAEAQRTLFPVRHLLALANDLFEELFSHLCETTILDFEHFLEVILEVDEVGEIFVKLHAWKIIS